MQFRQFIINESHAYLGQRIGDILNSLHDLGESGQHMGSRLLMYNAEAVVQQIRRILHTHWDKSEMKYLPTLQKVGVAIMKAIDGKNKDKSDLLSVLQGATSEVEKLSSDLGVPLNNLGSPATLPTEDDTGVQPSQGQSDSKKQQSGPQNPPPAQNQPPTPPQQPQVPDDGQLPVDQPGQAPQQPPNQAPGL